ncbi:MAG TPA: DUF4365 domain-containing protein [Chlamydiales bacterium]|jgi:hypothetical protein|nr:DUF4365 domain-containing protein [Chlamydiales bacterium]
MERLTDKVRKAVGEGNLEMALEILQNYLSGKNVELYNEVILHKASLNQNNLRARQGTTTDDDASRVRTRINLAVLSFVTGLEKHVIRLNEDRDQNLTFDSGKTLDDAVTVGKLRTLKDNESRELFLIGEVFRITAGAGHIFRPTSNSDWGIDGEIEFKDDKGNASGRRVYLQLKSGDSHVYRRKRDNKEIFTIKNPRHIEYWIKQPCPVLLVLCNSTGQIRWMNITDYLQFYGADRKQIEFKGEPFTITNFQQIQQITNQ